MSEVSDVMPPEDAFPLEVDTLLLAIIRTNTFIQKEKFKKMKKLFVIFAVIGMVGMFAATTMAADWSFYGSARMGTWWVTEDKKGDEEMDLAWAEQGNARIGARVAVSDTLSGRFEYGVSGGNANQRLLYADWDFGAGVMRVGQAYAPGNIFISNQVFGSDNNILNFGGMYSGRVEEISFKFAKIFEIAFIQPSTGYLEGYYDGVNDPTAGGPGDDGGTNIDITIPKIEAALVYNQENWWVQGTFGYQTMKAKDETAGIAGVDVDVTSYMYGVGGMFNMAGFYVGAVVMGGSNVDPYGLYVSTDATPTPTADANGKITGTDDTTTLGYNLVLGYTINDMLTVEGGWGYISSDNDNYDKADAATAYYINLPITLAPGVSITPEFGVEDQLKDANDVDEGSDTYFGAKWMINF